MLATLVGEELVNGSHRPGVGSADAEHRAARQIAHLVANRLAASPHDRNARNRLQVHGGRRREIARGKGASDLAQVRPDRGGAGGVVSIPLQLDPAAVRKCVETVDGGVLIDAHHGFPSRLHGVERGIAMYVRVPGIRLREDADGVSEDDRDQYHKDEAHEGAPR